MHFEGLKGSYDDATNNNIFCIWCNTMFLHGLKFKTLFSSLPLCSLFKYFE